MKDDYIIPPGEPAYWTKEQLAIACRNLQALEKAREPKPSRKQRIRDKIRPRFVDEWGLEEQGCE